ncbi:serine protease [Tepidimonas taiwanensis]|uniref:serine protease n=1 Tax=Tepidimonas taiwanensis TaxID=307486 RepID=UPI0012E0A467|nr:serine protease [Tepidimonas taiwanensis]
MSQTLRIFPASGRLLRTLGLIAVISLGALSNNARSEENKLPSLSAFSSAASRAMPELKQENKRIEIVADPYVFSLSEPNPSEQLLRKDQGPVLQIGYGRVDERVGAASNLAQKLSWKRDSVGNWQSSLRLISPKAGALRARLSFSRIDPRSRLYFIQEDGQVLLEKDGFNIIESSARDSDLGVVKNGRYSVVSPTAQGESLTVVFVLPGALDKDKFEVSVDWVSHFAESVEKTLDSQIGESLVCQRNIACAADPDQRAGRSVARLVFSDPASGASYLCTGTLLNNRRQDFTPYLLTASHCIASQSFASTLEAWWNYQAPACSSATMSSEAFVTRGGGLLLSAQSAQDTTLIQLNQVPAGNVVFAAWDANVQSLMQSVAGIHHPRGDLKKISFGTNGGYLSCADSSGGSFSCSESTAAVGDYHGVLWDVGTTEPGSSGSSLFRSVGGDRYVIGVLRGGTSACSGSVSVYGRFDKAFQNGLKKWLDPVVSLPPRNPVYRFYNDLTRSHFFTISKTERDFVVANYPSFRYEGIAFYAYPSKQTGVRTVYRFYNTSTGAHFYTISEAERDHVRKTYPQFLYEGEAWFVGDSVTGVPLYRFYNQATGAHFYTTNQQERDFIIANYPSYLYEGVAYYVWATEK